MYETVEEQMVKHQKFTSVETARDLLDAKKSWMCRQHNIKLHIKIGFNSKDGVEHITDISNISSITELSAYLRRADVSTYVMFYVISTDEKPTSPFCVIWTKKVPNTWFINFIT